MSIEPIRREIRRHGPIPFARFMELALYHEEGGYYANGAARLGPAGDYVTAADAGRSFGRCLVRQLLELDRAIGPLEPFDYVEFGAGRGLLARDVLDAARALDPDFASRLSLTLVDRSASMRQQAALEVPEAQVRERVAPSPRRGAVVAVELFDALPVHRLRRTRGALVEVHVDLDREGGLVEIEAPPVPAAAELAERYGAAPAEGDVAEVSPEAGELLDGLVDTIDEGLVIIVDYGHAARELYGPARREGTLLAYRAHTTNVDYLARPGEQDLTAHVNFTQLVERANERGARVLALTSQDRFLVANGILEEFEGAGDARWHEPRRVKRRLQALQLIHPAGMGRAFRVLVLGRGLPSLSLAGLRDPFAGAAHAVAT